MNKSVFSKTVVKQLRIQCNLTNNLKLVNEGYQNANQNNSLNCCIAVFPCPVFLPLHKKALNFALNFAVRKRGVRRHMLRWNKLPCWHWGPAHLFVMSSSWRCQMCFLPMEDGDVKKPQDQPLKLFRICFPWGWPKDLGVGGIFSPQKQTLKHRNSGGMTGRLGVWFVLGIFLGCFPNYDRWRSPLKWGKFGEYEYMTLPSFFSKHLKMPKKSTSI